MSDTPNARIEMLIERNRLLSENPHITTAAELAPLMGEHEREYWSWCIQRALATGTYRRKEESQ